MSLASSSPVSFSSSSLFHPSPSHLISVPEETEIRTDSDTPLVRTVLAAVKCGEACQVAVQWALYNVSRPGDVFVLLYVQTPHSTGGEVKDVEQKLEKMATEAREKYMVRCEVVVKEGEAADVILKEVVLRDPITLIMGSRGPTKRSVMGSTSDYCTKHSDCPVIVIRNRS